MTHPDDATLQTWHDGELPEADAAAVRDHVAACARCAAKLGALRSLHGAFDAWASAAPGADDDLADSILAKLNSGDAAGPPPVAPATVTAPETPSARVVSLDAAREARRPAPARRMLWPALAAAAAFAIFVGTRIPPRVFVAPHPSPVARADAAPSPSDPQAEPVVVGSAGDTTGAEVVRVDVQGAESYSVLEIPGMSPGVTTAVVWIQDPPDEEGAAPEGAH